jgi:hypothetical protein
MTAIGLHPAVLGYVTEVGVALGDLDVAERVELLGEVHEHVQAVLEDSDEPPSFEHLVQRLGRPGDYAAELRTAAGLAPRESGGRELRLPINAAVFKDWSDNIWRESQTYLRRLVPAWWVLRGFLTSGVAVLLTTDLPNGVAARYTFRKYDLAWFNGEYFGVASQLRSFVLVAVLTVLSVVCGVRAERGSPGARYLGFAFAVVGLIGLAVAPMWYLGPAFHALAL